MSRILLVQERLDAALALLDELQRAEVEPVEDGAAALHRMLSSPPELTLLGIDLPQIDGLRILETARNSSDQPIIVLTARRQEADLLRGFELGADDYVCTPYSPREVAARIRTVLRRRAHQLRAANRPVPIAIGNPPGTVVLEGHHCRSRAASSCCCGRSRGSPGGCAPDRSCSRLRSFMSWKPTSAPSTCTSRTCARSSPSCRRRPE